MKANIHPTFYEEALVTCRSCGNTFKTGMTKESMTIEVCSKCHPFFTGEHRFLDAKGRVEDFNRKIQTAKEHREKHGDKKSKKEMKSGQQTKSLRELLGEI